MERFIDSVELIYLRCLTFKQKNKEPTPLNNYVVETLGFFDTMQEAQQFVLNSDSEKYDKTRFRILTVNHYVNVE